MAELLTPGEKERRRALRALREYEANYGLLDELERAAFLHGWRQGDRGQALSEAVAEIDSGHRDADKALLALAQGHHGGQAAFRREEPDYDSLRERLASEGLATVAAADESAKETGIRGALISFFERHG